MLTVMLLLWLLPPFSGVADLAGYQILDGYLRLTGREKSI